MPDETLMDIDARIEGLVSKDGNKILLFAVQCNAVNFLVGGVENTNRAEAEATSAAYVEIHLNLKGTRAPYYLPHPYLPRRPGPFDLGKSKWCHLTKISAMMSSYPPG